MFGNDWVCCGNQFPRLEIFGLVEQAQGSVLSTLTGIRLRIKEGDDAGAVFLRMRVRKFELDKPIPLIQSGNNLQISKIPDNEISIEGLENPSGKFFGFLLASGWKLQLKQEAANLISFSWSFISDWELAVPPAKLPGTAIGDTIIAGKFSTDGTQLNRPQRLGICIPWPFSIEGKFMLSGPHWTGLHWRAGLGLETMASLFHGTGIFKDFPFANIVLTGFQHIAPEILDDLLYLETGTTSSGEPFFDIVLGTKEVTTLAEIAGMRLELWGQAALVFHLELEPDFLLLSCHLRLGSLAPNSTGLRLTGPFIRSVESAAGIAREVVSMISGSDIKIPQIEFFYAFPQGNWNNIDMGTLRVPLNPALPSGSNAFSPLLNFLSGIPFSFPQAALDTLNQFKLGPMTGNAPEISLKILNAHEYHNASEMGISCDMELSFKIFGDPVTLLCHWIFVFNFNTLAFVPRGTLHLSQGTRSISFAGFTIEGIDSLGVTWGTDGLSLSASGLKAYYSGLTQSGDPSKGFELLVDSLLIDSGGIDLVARISGGTTVVRGIGDHFKAVEGGVSIARSRIVKADFRAEGALPWLDNATGSLAIVFGEEFRLREVKAEFQMGKHSKSDWWVDVDLQRINIDLDFSAGRFPNLVIKITGKVIFTPPGGSDNFLLNSLSAIEIGFDDMPLTKDFAAMASHISLVVQLREPILIPFFGAFEFELRSIGIVSGFNLGEAAMHVGGQVFMSSDDTIDTNPNYHVLEIGNPPAGEFIPAIRFENLPINFCIGSTLEVNGNVSVYNSPERRGFKGNATLIIGESLRFLVIVEISNAIQPGTGREVRIWMVYAERQEINQHLVMGFFLRDVGVGFGWRKTLAVMDNPMMVLEDPSKSLSTISPHLPSSWVDDMEGDDARWTVVLSSWVTLGLSLRSMMTIITGELLIGIRSDLTFIAVMRAWVFASLESTKKKAGNPPVKGVIYYSNRRKYFLAAFVLDPSAAAPEGIPPPIVESLLGPPFSFLLEADPNLFRLELGWPRQLDFPLNGFRGKAGLLFRKAPGALTIGAGFEIYIGFEKYLFFNFGIATLSIGISIYIGVYGMILLRIGNRPALYGIVGLNAYILIYFILSVNFKIWFVRIRFTISISIQMTISARVDFGISDAGFGMAGYAMTSMSIWMFSFSFAVSFSINESARAEAYSRVFEGATAFGSEDDPPTVIRQLPAGDAPLPALPAPQPRWRMMFVQSEEGNQKYVYLLLLPEKDSWFANPLQPEKQNDPYPKSLVPDYEIEFNLQNVVADEKDEQAVISGNKNNPRIKFFADWNTQIDLNKKTSGPINSESSTEELIPLGALFSETTAVRQEHRLIDTILRLYQPELLSDPRVRAPKTEDPYSDLDTGVRPDVRSPKFSDEDSLYDRVLETAFKNEKGSELSWEQIAVGFTRWTDAITQEDKAEVFDYLFDPEQNEISKIKPTEKIDLWRKQLLDGLTNMRSNRSSLAGRLLMQFREWTLFPEKTLNAFPLLKKSGLAMRFKIENSSSNPPLPWSIQIKSIQINQGDGSVHHLDSSQVHNSTITGNDSGLGFARDEYDYHVKDILEFQDKEGIHFSWILECRDSENNRFDMSPHDLVRIGNEEQLANLDYFEYFDHYLVERMNLSQPEPEGEKCEREVRPGFVPALFNAGTSAQKFYMVAPRFDFSDIISPDKTAGDKLKSWPHVSTGDELLYRISAVDIFGNSSQVTEIITSRKNIEIPPAPGKGKIRYEVALCELPAENKERLILGIETGEEMQNWQGGTLTYEFWVQSYSIVSCGFMGINDGVENETGSASKPLLSPQGMSLIGKTESGTFIVPGENLKNLAFGLGHIFYVRSVSTDGNASRLIRCENSSAVTVEGSGSIKEIPMPFMERIPPYSPASAGWVDANDIRASVGDYSIPVYSGLENDPLYFQTQSGTGERELLLRFLHKRFIGNQNLYLTGAYEIFVRDRDSSIGQDRLDYGKLADVEVVSLLQYLTTPENTSDDQKWDTRFIAKEEIPAGSENAFTFWGHTDTSLVPGGQSIFPENSRVHPWLYSLLTELNTLALAAGYEITLHGGLPDKKAHEDFSYKKLSGNYGEGTDKTGINLLKWMGRVADLSILKGNKAVSFHELKNWIDTILAGNEGWKEYHVLLELLTGGDRSTLLNYVRISLQPVLLPKSEEEDRQKLSEQSFRKMMNALFSSSSLTSFPGLPAQDGILTDFMKRYPEELPLTNAGLLHIGVTCFRAVGNYQIPLQKDSSLLLNINYTELYARRFGYRIKMVSRYHLLYKEFGFVDEAGIWKIPAQEIVVRFPRVKPPRPPVIQFAGNFYREETRSSEWLIAEHEEEMMVQSNEMLRNRLGYRGMAWNLFTEIAEGLEAGSGWKNQNVNWYNKPDDRFATEMKRLSEDEIKILEQDAGWREEAAQGNSDGLAGHPFTELLAPKGLIIRVPRLPFYYRYKLAAFARTDDIDSEVSISDQVSAEPSIMPELNETFSGWQITGSNESPSITFWWRVPSVFDSLDANEQILWKNDKPLASRLWDFDLEFQVSTERNASKVLQAAVKPAIAKEFSGTQIVPEGMQRYRLTSLGGKLYLASPGKVEALQVPVIFPSHFFPEISFTMKIDTGFRDLLEHSDDFTFLLECFRKYGTARSTSIEIHRKEKHD